MSQNTEKDAAASDTKRLLTTRWYLIGQPWCHSSQSGTAILAGSEDPHAGTFVADTDVTDTECPVDYDNPDMQSARAIAQHIVDLHNASLEEGG